MTQNLKENLPRLEILIGYFLYLYLIIESTFSIAILWLLLIIYIWLLTALFLNQYSFNSFVHIICCSGIIVSITLFFTTGVEELPFPEGALLFHPEGISKSFLLFFIFTTPLIITNKKNNGNKKQKNNPTAQQESNYDESLWEEATIEDVESGQYDTI